VRVISRDPPCKDDSKIVFISVSFLIATYKQKSHFRRETANENKQFNLKHKKYNLIFKGTVVNRALPYLHGGSLEVMLTVPLISIYSAWIRLAHNVVCTFYINDWIYKLLIRNVFFKIFKIIILSINAFIFCKCILNNLFFLKFILINNLVLN